MGTEEKLVQRNTRYGGTVGTEEHWVRRNTRYRGTGVGTEEQRVQRNSGYRGTVGIVHHQQSLILILQCISGLLRNESRDCMPEFARL